MDGDDEYEMQNLMLILLLELLAVFGAAFVAALILWLF